MLHLNYKSYGHAGHPVIILHGLLGMLDNWQTQSKRLAEHHFKVYAVDQRNHGKSPHSDTFNYEVMADDVRGFMREHHLASAHVIGHSMGGKTAMQFALTYPALVDSLIVVDVAPRAYANAHACVPERRTSACRHDEILDAMCALKVRQLSDRAQVDTELAKRIPDFSLRQFILKNLARNDAGEFKWKVNLAIIKKHYPEIANDITVHGTFQKPTLFVKGGRSKYIAHADEPRIYRLFPDAKIVTIHGTGHWVHADKPEEFGDAVLTFFCNIDCIFCAFYRHPGEAGEYTYTVDQMIRNFKESAKKGVTTVLLQGGVNPAIPFEYYIEMVERTIKEVPEVYPHFYSTSEIIGMAEVSGFTVQEVLQSLWAAGQRSIPGGGAEILSDRVKKKISNKKGSSEEWLMVMREAHKIGFKSTATMMYGHLEHDEDIVEHLEAIRRLQDEYHGFTAFVPWSFKPGNTPLEKIIPQYATPTRYLQMIAFSRMYLDNFDHIQASWFSEGKKTGQIALHFGADDFGGTLLEENVHAAANFVNTTNTEECIGLIHGAGFAAAQRTTLYEILREYPLIEQAAA